MRFSGLVNHRQNMYLEMYLGARKGVAGESLVESAEKRPRKIPQKKILNGDRRICRFIGDSGLPLQNKQGGVVYATPVKMKNYRGTNSDPASAIERKFPRN